MVKPVTFHVTTAGNNERRGIDCAITRSDGSREVGGTCSSAEVFIAVTSVHVAVAPVCAGSFRLRAFARKSFSNGKNPFKVELKRNRKRVTGNKKKKNTKKTRVTSIFCNQFIGSRVMSGTGFYFRVPPNHNNTPHHHPVACSVMPCGRGMNVFLFCRYKKKRKFT